LFISSEVKAVAPKFKIPRLLTEGCDNGREDEIARNFIVYFTDGTKVIVYKGFITDYASTPRFLWRILPPWDKHKRAAVVHDWFYRGGNLIRPDGSKYRPCRKESDQKFKELMDRLDVESWKAITMYDGVRLFGRKSYVTNPKKFTAKKAT